MNTEDGTGCTLERTYEVLSHPTRRVLLRRLRDVETTTVRAAAANLVEAERIEDPDRVEVMLYHVHLPKLADAGILGYDPDTGAIRTNETTGAVYDVLETLAD